MTFFGQKIRYFSVFNFFQNFKARPSRPPTRYTHFNFLNFQSKHEMDQTILLENPLLGIEDTSFDLLTIDDHRINWRPSYIEPPPEIVHLNPFNHDGPNLLLTRALTPHHTHILYESETQKTCHNRKRRNAIGSKSDTPIDTILIDTI